MTGSELEMLVETITHENEYSDIITADKPESPERNVYGEPALPAENVTAAEKPEADEDLSKAGMLKTIKINKMKNLDFQSNEAFKALRTNIEFCGSDIKVIALTSCVPNEGKSSVSFNLAMSMAEASKKILYLDADMRKSVTTSRYRMSNVGGGMSHYLAGRKDFSEIIYDTNIMGFYMIPSGPTPPNPSELLGSKRFAFMIENLKKVYDYIVIDTPPLGSVIDAAVIAKQCDGIAMVIETSAVGRKLAQNTIAQIKKTDCPFLGVILNKVDIYNKKYGKYYGKYYGNYYEYE